MDSRGAAAARPFIERTKSTFPCLIDRHYRITALYHISNIPMAVWVDEAGRIVRPPEATGNDQFKGQGYGGIFGRGRFGRTLGGLNAEGQQALRDYRQPYVAALTDWIEYGAASRYVLTREQALARLELATPNRPRHVPTGVSANISSKRAAKPRASPSANAP